MGENDDEMFCTFELARDACVKYYRSLREQDGRHKKRVLALVPSKKQFKLFVKNPTKKKIGQI